jgi:hypothetical protein
MHREGISPPAFDSDTMDTARSTYYCAAAGRFVSCSSSWWCFHVAKRIGGFNRDRVQIHQKNGAMGDCIHSVSGHVKPNVS